MNNKTKTIIIGVIIVLVAVGIFWGLKNNKTSDGNEQQGGAAPDQTRVVLPPPEQKTGELPNQVPSAVVLPTETRHVVNYTDKGFAPATITIKKGEKITFQNSSSLGFWPASGHHPTHELYPEKGGCISSAFDACAEYQPGQSWAFQFNYVGSWTYHDHLAPSHTGIVVVTK